VFNIEHRSNEKNLPPITGHFPRIPMTPPDFPVFRIQERVDPYMSYPIIQALNMTVQPTPDQFIAVSKCRWSAVSGGLGSGADGEVIRELLTVWLVFRFKGRIHSRMKLLKCLPLLLCLCCAYSQEVTKEEIKKWRAKAEQGDAVTQFNLGVCYKIGKGVPQDDAEAVKWFRKAADQGDADAQCHLGFYCYNGVGVPQDDTEALKWYRKSADQGNIKAQVNLARCYAKGKGVPQDDAEAVKWFRKAADQGDADAQVCLGACYMTGKGLPKDDVTAYMWFNLASAQDLEDAKKGKEIASESMTKEQIAEAQKLSREWLEKRKKVE
jgi:hypothetical protein